MIQHICMAAQKIDKMSAILVISVFHVTENVNNKNKNTVYGNFTH